MLTGDKDIYPNCIQDNQESLVALVDRLLNIVKWLKIQRIRWFKLYKNGLDKACFVHDAAYANSKDLTKKLCQASFWKIEFIELL